MVVTRDWWERNEGLLFDGYRVSGLHNKVVHNSVNVPNNYTLKNSKFYMLFFTTILRKRSNIGSN